MKLIWLFIVGVSILALASTTGVIYADSGDASLVHACLKQNGAASIVEPTSLCKSNETSLHWGITGPQGPAPADISVRVFDSQDVSIPSAILTILLFDSERWDTDDIHDTAIDTSRLTAQTAGKYYIFAHIKWDAGGADLRLRILLNNTTLIAEVSDVGRSGPSNAQSIGTHYELNVGDYVEVQVRQAVGFPVDILRVDASSPEFGMVKLP